MKGSRRLLSLPLSFAESLREDWESGCSSGSYATGNPSILCSNSGCDSGLGSDCGCGWGCASISYGATGIGMGSLCDDRCDGRCRAHRKSFGILNEGTRYVLRAHLARGQARAVSESANVLEEIAWT
ncbi:hypothetical protein HFD88_008390 [Aspergillus terreus]|nr:hypothetical protein HFD88_008390 [Aspergillus terreus]